MTNLKNLSRIQILGILLTLFAGLIVFQMIRIQTSASAKNLSQWAKNYGYQVTTIQSERGYIYDRWGHLLAGNEEVYELGAELQYVTNPTTVAQTLASVVGSDYNTVFSQASEQYIEGSQVYVTLADFVDSDKIAQIEKLKADYEKSNPYGSNPNLPSLRGLTWTAHLKRIYPENDLASNVIGFYSYRDRENGRGFYGVEEKYNDLLAGIKEQVLIPLDPYELQSIPTAPAGASLILTIDREIQRATENILDKAVKTPVPSTVPSSS